MAKLTDLLQLFVLALIVAAFTGSASAVPITYVFTGTASGTLVETPFSNTLLTVIATGDTDNVTFSGSVYANNTLNTTIMITGFATMTVTPGPGNHDYVFDNHLDSGMGYGVTGIPSCCDIITFINNAYATYDLKSSIGPLSSPSDLSISDWVAVPTDQGPLWLSSYTSNTFTATVAPTSITQTLEPGVLTVYTFNADNYKITPIDNVGGESLTITAVPILQSQFQPPQNFPNETCVPFKDASVASGADTCVLFQADCTQGTATVNDCDTLLYTLLESFDLPADLPAIGGPDFLVVHGSGCPVTPSGTPAQSIFTDYYVTRIDPTLKGKGSGTGSCFEAMYTPGAPAITTGTVSSSQFVGWGLPVVNGQLNMVKAGSTRPLIFNWNDGSGNPVANLNYCPNMSGTGCTAPWVNLSSFGIVCANGTPVNTATDTPSTSSAGNSGFQNNGGGNYQLNWQTQKLWKGYCANVEATFYNGLVVVPASVGFQFN